MRQKGMKKFVCRTLLALLPVFGFVALYLCLDPFRVVYRYDGIAVLPGDTLERIPNKRYVAIEGLKYYSGSQHYDSFIFGSSISSNFTAAAWKRHLPDTASVYHFTAGAEPLEGIRDELRYLFENHYNVRHALLIMEEEMFRRPKRYGEMPYVPHWDVSSEVSWLDFHRAHFNAFRDPYILMYNLCPSRVVDRLLADGKLQTVASGGHTEETNEDSSRGLDSLIISNPGVDYIIVRPSDAPIFVETGAADCGICGEDSLLESASDVVELVDLRFGSCRFIVAEPAGAEERTAEHYRQLGSIRVATKYPRIARAHFAHRGTQVEIVQLHGNIELGPLTGLADCIVDITATGTTLRENNLVVVDEVMGSTARFFANVCSLRTDARVSNLARTLSQQAAKHELKVTAGGEGK